MKLHVIDRGAKPHVLEAANGSTVMENLRDSLDNAIGTCGGACTCGTCHVVLDEIWASKLPPPAGDEPDMLEALENPGVAGVLRLGCQIRLVPELDGLTVTLAPEP